MKSPTECQNMEDIRTEIDAIDKEIIVLIGQRAEYVKAAAKFKVNRSDVNAADRVKAMMIQRRQWAQDNRINADLIETIYKELVNHFISEEFMHWDDFNPGNDGKSN
jgi:isochorismate pyruvate lyase